MICINFVDYNINIHIGGAALNSKEDKKKQAEIRDRRKKILMMLLDRPYTVTELMEHFHVSKKSIQDDINELQTTYDISRHKKNIGYVIPEDKKEEYRMMADTSAIYKHSVRDDITKTVIVLLIQREGGSVSEEELIDEYKRFYDLDSDDSLIEFEDVSAYRRYIRNNCDELEKEGVIEKQVKENKGKIINTYVMKPSKNAPVYLCMNKDILDTYLYAMKAYGPTYILKDEIKLLEHKLNMYSEHFEFSNDSNFISIGNKINRNPSIVKCLEMFRDIEYDKYAIILKINGKEITVKTGIMVYVADKDKLYIIGKSKKEKGKIIDVEKISDIRVDKKIKNDIYNDEYYINIYKEMFSISTEQPEEIRVEIKKFANVQNKFETLSYRRDDAKVIDKDKDHFIYEDKIRGIADFAKYLRQYGRCIQIVEPAKLRDEMKADLSRHEERYRSEGLLDE